MTLNNLCQLYHVFLLNAVQMHINQLQLCFTISFLWDNSFTSILLSLFIICSTNYKHRFFHLSLWKDSFLNCRQSANFLSIKCCTNAYQLTASLFYIFFFIGHLGQFYQVFSLNTVQIQVIFTLSFISMERSINCVQLEITELQIVC